MQQQTWQTRFNELVAYKEKNDNCNVPQSDGAFGRWVRDQRFKYKKGKLSQERAAQLEGIRFAWVIRQHQTSVDWQTRFNTLVAYKEKNGNCNVPQKRDFGRWVHNQRQLYTKGKLSQERTAQLECIGFEWAVEVQQHWEERFTELVSYKEKNGNCNVPKREGALGIWVSNQRSMYKKGKLSQERTTQLEGINFNWSMREHSSESNAKQWGKQYVELVDYNKKNGNCRVPRKHGALGNWVDNQRSKYKKGKLSQERIAQLESIGFEWLVLQHWEERFNVLVAYKEKNGNCKVPKREGALGIWVQNQRSKYRKGELTQEQISQLEGIGFKWRMKHIPDRNKSERTLLDSCVHESSNEPCDAFEMTRVAGNNNSRDDSTERESLIVQAWNIVIGV